MYSKKVMKFFDDANASVGDVIELVDKVGKTMSGILMPKTEAGDADCVVVKLSSGYNVGINVSSIKKMKVVEKGLKGIEVKAVKAKAAEKAKPSKDDIVILGCGGTIASKIDYKSGAVYPAIDPEELAMQFPVLREKSVRTRSLFQLLSEDMSTAHWQLIAEEVANEIKNGAKGVILMHGTDTLHYTSAALSFMLKTPVPVVLVGAQRSSDRGSSDNLMNINSAVMIAESDIAEVGVCMHATTNDDYCYFHPGVRVRKMHTSRRDAFRTINGNPIAKINPESGRIEKLSEYSVRGERKLEVDTKIDPDVALVYTYPGIKPKFIERLADDYKGVVIAGTGLGHVPTNVGNDPKAVSLIPAIKGLIESGIPVVIAPQTIFGRVNLNVYAAGRAMLDVGVIGNYCDWTPETALVKLMWVLGHTKDMRKINDMMHSNLAGEISERTELLEI
jgi:glutamyl-tRNA(Gln) amidotransferase subunit D